jgi:hypothetical protein
MGAAGLHIYFSTENDSGTVAPLKWARSSLGLTTPSHRVSL